MVALTFSKDELIKFLRDSEQLSVVISDNSTVVDNLAQQNLNCMFFRGNVLDSDFSQITKFFNSFNVKGHILLDVELIGSSILKGYLRDIGFNSELFKLSQD